MYQQPQRIDYFDSLRGLAALAVLLGHSFIFQWPPTLAKWASFPCLHLAVDGRAAVAMFFVLSGFVLSRPYFIALAGAPPRKIYLPTFYVRRITRIWLPWLFAFGLSAVAQATIFREWSTVPPTNDWYHRFWHTPLTWMNFLHQCIFTEHNAGIQLIVQDWSLGVELKASAMLPLFIFLARKWSSWSLLPVSVLLLVLLPTGHFYISFIMGILLARHGDPVVQWLKPRPLPVKISLLLAGLVFYEANHFGVDLLGRPAGVKYFWLGTGLGCIFILLASLSSRRIQAALRLPPVMFLGRISYSVYLLQFIVILCLVPPWIHALNTLGILRTRWLLPLELLGSVSMTVGLSALTYRWVEMPCIDFGHWLSKQWQGKLSQK